MNLSEPDPSADWSDREYVESSRNGCPDQFRILVQRYQKPVYAYLNNRLGNPADAEEATQESFVRAFITLRSLRKPDSFYSWLLGIAQRVAKEQFRSRQTGQRQREAAAEALVVNDNSDNENGQLEQAIASLPENYRQAILLRYYQGLSCQEVALRLCAPLGTVTKTLSRAYVLLRQELASLQHSQQTIKSANP